LEDGKISQGGKSNSCSGPKDLFYSIIVDGIHAHPASINMANKCHPAGAVLVTDAMSAMGLDSGSYVLGEIPVTVDTQKNTATVTGTPTLAGSIARMDDCVRNYRKYTGCSLVEAVEAATLHPAQVLGLENTKGNLVTGADADLILLDDDLNVHAVIVNGQLAWQKTADTLFLLRQE